MLEIRDVFCGPTFEPVDAFVVAGLVVILMGCCLVVAAFFMCFEDEVTSET